MLRSMGDHPETGPSAVVDQSKLLASAPIAPPPSNILSMLIFLSVLIFASSTSVPQDRRADIGP